MQTVSKLSYSVLFYVSRELLLVNVKLTDAMPTLNLQQGIMDCRT